jgi:multiple antibiotic resistance protein
MAMIVFFKALLVVPITLLPILNPIAIAPIFLSMTGPIEPEIANRLAKRIAINCFFLLMGAIFIGSYVLDFSAFRCLSCALPGASWSAWPAGNY